MAVSARLFTAPSVRVAREGAFLPWHETAGAAASQHALPTLVVVPTRGDAYAVKGWLLAAGRHALGVHFVTPPRLREMLVARMAVTADVPLREHLHLLLAAAAEDVSLDAQDAAAAVAAAPDPLLKTIDQLTAGGWAFAEAGAPRREAIRETHRRRGLHPHARG